MATSMRRRREHRDKTSLLAAVVQVLQCDGWENQEKGRDGHRQAGRCLDRLEKAWPVVCWSVCVLPDTCDLCEGCWLTLS